MVDFTVHRELLTAGSRVTIWLGYSYHGIKHIELLVCLTGEEFWKSCLRITVEMHMAPIELTQPEIWFWPYPEVALQLLSYRCMSSRRWAGIGDWDLGVQFPRKWLRKTGEISNGHLSPKCPANYPETNTDEESSNLYFDNQWHRRQHQPMEGHVSYPSESHTATKSELCCSLWDM